MPNTYSIKTHNISDTIIFNEAYKEVFKNPNDENVLNGAIRKVKISVLETEADAYRDQLRSDLNPKSMALILEKYSDCLRELRRYIDEENNS